MANNNYKVFLYKPEAVSVTADNAGPYFLGELLVDNLDVSIKLQDISTVNFSLPRVINNTANTRIDEVLDGYVIELWYGNLSGTLNQDYYKYRFTIYTTPLSFSDNKFLHSYTGYSLEALTELKMLVSWPGIEISDFFRKVSYNNSGATPKFLEAKNTSVGGNFEYTITTSGSGSDYITLTPTTAVAADIDIFVYEVRQRLSSGNVVSESEAGLIPYSGTGPNDVGFKNGYYFLTISGGFVTQIHVALPDNYTSFNGESVNSQLLFFKLYDNPLSRRYAIGITTNAEQANDMYIDLAHDVATGSPTDFNNFNFQTQTFYSKNGLTLKQVLLGKENTTVNTITEDGLLYNTGFTLGTIHASLLNEYRSNLEFNNLSRYAAIKNLAESFDAIAIYDTVANTVSFYPENIYGVNNGLIIRYGAYLKALNKEIDASKIITNAIGLGKDNLTINLVNPTGSSYWEDYSYYLDDYYIENAAEIGAITEDVNLGITFNYVSTSGYSSRWMSAALAEKVGKWQYTRDWFHSILTGEYNPTSFSSTITQFYNFYENRLEAIRLLIKQETQYFTALKKEVKYEAFKNYYDKLSKDNPSNTTYSGKLAYYTNQLNNAKTINAALLSDLNDARDDIFDENTAGSYAAKMVVLRGFLQKDSATRTINLDSLRPFQRETVVNDSSVDDEKDLLQIVKTHVDENKEPKVTISIDIADILAAQEAQEDWKKVKVGDKINIYLDELNVDVVAQIREINVNFEEHSLSFVISTVRNYNKGFGNFVLKTIRNLYNSNNNNVAYEIDGSRYSKATSQNVNEVLQNGINTGDTKVTSGLQDDAGNPGTQINGSGTSSASIASVDEFTESVTSYVSPATQGVIVVDGKLLAYHNYTSPTTYSSEVEISADTGFTIRKISGGTIEKQVYIDTNGNAVFAGSLSAGVSGLFDPAGSAAQALVDAEIYADGIETALQNQIDGAIDTWFYNGTPTLINEPAVNWTTNDLKNQHLGDIYYDNSTGYAYRFTNSPSYGWVVISDSAVIQALEEASNAQDTADGKMTIFYASSAAQLAGYTTQQTGDLLIIGVDFPTPNPTYFKNDSYTWTGSAWSKVQNIENKDTGSIAGWTISATNIKANNNKMTLHSDSDNTGWNPYISIGQTTEGYEENGAFMGIVGETGSGNGVAKLSLKNGSNGLFWNGSTLAVVGNITATTGTIGGFTTGADFFRSGADNTKLLLKHDATNPFMSIGQSTNGYAQPGIFLGLDSNTTKFSINPIVTRTFNTTSGSTILTGGNTTNLTIGMLITGTGILAGTYVESITDSTTLVMTGTANTTGTAALSFTNGLFSFDGTALNMGAYNFSSLGLSGSGSVRRASLLKVYNISLDYDQFYMKSDIAGPSSYSETFIEADSLKTASFSLSANPLFGPSAYTTGTLSSTRIIFDRQNSGVNSLFGSIAISANNLALGQTRIYNLPNVGADAEFVMTQGAQTIAGTKTFSSTISGSIDGSASTASSASTAASISTGSSTSNVNFSGSTAFVFSSSEFRPATGYSRNLGNATQFFLGVYTCTIYRNSELGLSDVYSKKDIKNIIIDGVPLYEPESLKQIEITPEEENFFEGVKTLFEKLSIYTFNYIGSETNQPSKIGVMAQEIEEILEDYPVLLSLLIMQVTEEIKDENDNVINTQIKKYLRTDNLDTLKTIMIKYIYFKIKNLEETISKIKYVLINKEIATEEELV